MSGVKVSFGIQGKIEVIETILTKWNDNDIGTDMTYSKVVWNEIGKKIGWCPFTASLHYFEYLANKEN